MRNDNRISGIVAGGLGPHGPQTGPSTEPRSQQLSTANESLWNVDEVAAYLQVTSNSVYKMTAKKASVRIPHIRLGGKLRFRRADIVQWLELLTVSNIKTLSKLKRSIAHGDTSQAQAP